MNNNIDELLNECLERVVFRGESLEDVLKSHPAEAAELEPLIKTALMVKQAAAVTPRPEFRARTRYEFHEEFARQKSARHGFSFGFLPRWATALSVAMAVLLASGGAVAASTTSMPDSPLYPVKLATEQARMAITFSDDAKAELYAELTDNRVNEIVYLANKGDTANIAVVSAQLDERMDNLAGVARVAVGKSSQANYAVSAPVDSASRSAAQNSPMAPKAAALPPSIAAGGPEAGGGLSGAVGTAGAMPAGGAAGMGMPSNEMAETTNAAVPTPALPPAPLFAAPAPQPQPGVAAAGAPDKTARATTLLGTPSPEREVKLKAILANYAAKHPAQLRAALDKVPEPARQDILRAIARTAAGYENALRSIDQP